MCGIVGFITTDVGFSRKKADFFETALYADAVRGRHSTGVFTIEKDGSAFFNKDIVDAQRYLDSQGSYRYVRSVDGGVRAAVGHNRYATNGGRGRDSAHPFVTDHVTLVHNGTLRDYQWLAKHPKADVDSARLAQTLSEDEPGGKATLEKLQGAYALVWYDNRTRNMYMVRNTERPLAYIFVDKTMYFASEGKMLEWVLSEPRAGITNSVKAKMVPTNAIHRWDVSGGDESVLKPKVVRYTPPKPPVHKSYQQNDWVGGAQAGQSTGKVLPAQSGATANVVSLTDADKKRFAALDVKLKDLGLLITHGDLVEIQAGELVSYAKGGTIGKTLGWFEEEEGELLIDDTGDFTGTVYADIHQVPLLSQEEVQKGHWHESYIGRIVGISAVKPDWMSETDVLLHTVYESVASRVEPFTMWKGKLSKFFKGYRHRYQLNDIPKHNVQGQYITNKELDMLSAGKKCSRCSINESMIVREDIRMSKNLKTFTCSACVTA